MSRTLSDYLGSKDNNYNLIRFVAAALVLYSHSFDLLGKGSEEGIRVFTGMISGGSLAVDIFFITSGFLITGSVLSRKSPLAFIWARVMRIYPALIVAMLFCVCVVGAYFTTFPLPEYFKHSVTWDYFKDNSTLLALTKYHLPGVFMENTYPVAVNGSLWTLPYEVKMYGLVAIISYAMIALEQKMNRSFIKWVFLAISVTSLTYTLTKHVTYVAGESYQGPGYRLFAMFFAGAASFYWKESIRVSHRWFVLSIAIFALTFSDKAMAYVCFTVFLSYWTFYLAYVPGGVIRRFNKLGDYSYGMYIYAFPVQQSVAALIPNVSVWQMTGIAFVVTMALSILSWHFVEKKCLRMKGGYLYLERFLVKGKEPFSSRDEAEKIA